MNVPVIDFLNAVDWVVPDLSAARHLISTLFPQLVVTGQLDLPDHGFASVFFRGPASLADAPTRIQLVTVWGASTSSQCDVAPFLPMQRAQGMRRRQRVHGTVLAVANFEESIKRLRATGAPVYVERECVHLPYLRAWLGWSDDGRTRVEEVDGGLFLEFIPIEVFPRSVRGAGSAPLSVPTPGLRTVGRVYLVDDLASALRQLRDGLGLAPAVCYEDRRLGVRAARFSFRHPGSADLVVAEARPDGLAAEYRHTDGPGVYLTTIACADGGDVVRRARKEGMTVTVLEEKPDLRAVVADESTGVRIEIVQGVADDR